jgi:hypothetical protein
VENGYLGEQINDALDAASYRQGYDSFGTDRLHVKGATPEYGGYYPMAENYDSPYCDTRFPGIQFPNNSSYWIEPGPYDAYIKVYGNGHYRLPANMVYGG